MKIGICGNLELETIAFLLDKKLPEHELIIGNPGSFVDELSVPQDLFQQLDFCIIAINWQFIIPESYHYSLNDDFQIVSEKFQEYLAIIKKCLVQYQQICNAKIFLFSPLSADRFTTGFLTRLLENSPFDLFLNHQKQFNSLCKSLTDVYPVDVDEIVNKIGRNSLLDVAINTNNGFFWSELFYESITDYIYKMITQFNKYPLKCIVLRP